MKLKIMLGSVAAATAVTIAGQFAQNHAVADRDDGDLHMRAVDSDQRALSRSSDMANVGDADAAEGGIAGTVGPDVAVCSMPGTLTYARLGNTHSFAFATNSLNVGDQDLLWQANNSNHPVIAQNLYRVRSGRIEMIGMAWLKHGFCALQQPGCGNCAVQGGCLSYLKPGCADPYSASLNGQQGGMGPRSEVNASTGVFPYPFSTQNQTGNAMYKRLQVHDDDLNPDLNFGAIYYIEGHYVHPQEGTSDRRHNNASYRRVTPTSTTVSGTSTYSLSGSFQTTQFLPAIYAWKDHVSDVTIEVVDIPGTPVDGRFHLGYRVRQVGINLWRYEYALHNMNSHRSAQAFSVPVRSGVNLTNIYHRDVKYHSGEPYTNDDWTVDTSGGAITWSGVPYSVNPNANALRWSTMFNFAFFADTPPEMGEVTISLFRPGTPDAVTVPVMVPTGVPVPQCPGDIDGNEVVNGFDLVELLAAWGPCDDVEDCPADIDGNGVVNGFDLVELLSNWGPC